MTTQTTPNSASSDPNLQPKPLHELRGVRAQCFNALKALADDKLAQAFHKISPSLSKHQRDYLFKTMKPAYFWHQADASKLRGYHMHRTRYPNPVFHVLLAQGWIEPTENEHPVPNMRYYRITYAGKQELESATIWFSKISFLQELWLNLTE